MKRFLSTLITPFSMMLLHATRVLAAVGEGGSPQSTGGQGLPNPLGVTSFEVLADKILGYMLVIAVPIATLMILVGAYQILFAAGDPEKVKTGKQTILYTVIAFAIILIGKGITLIIKDVLGVK